MAIKVVLVDDHALFREGLKSLLIARGIQVLAEAADGAQALEKVRETEPDVLLMDLDMPGIAGLEATRLIKADYPEIRIVILTASEAEADLFEAVKSGAQGYLLKSVEPDILIEQVEAAARGEPALTPDLASKLLNEFARIGDQGPTTIAHPPSAETSHLPTGPAVAGMPDELIVTPLTAREREVLELLVDGATNKEIADRLVVSENTTKYHLKNILQKLHAHNRAQVVAFALRHGLTRPPREP